jgi:hypothetical protein
VVGEPRRDKRANSRETKQVPPSLLYCTAVVENLKWGLSFMEAFFIEKIENGN